MADLIVHLKKPADWTDTINIHYRDTRSQTRPATFGFILLSSTCLMLMHLPPR